jgi:hypothetical protein
VTASTPETFDVTAFPRGRRGVLVPTRDRRTASLGVCMYTASKPRVVRVQQAAFWAVRMFGARALLGGSHPWPLPCERDLWEELCAQWRSCVGDFDGLASYQRRQSERDGTTLLLTREGEAVAVVKVRSQIGALLREQEALDAVERFGPVTFQAPRGLGSSTVSVDLHWSAQSSVFDRPHLPVLTAPEGLFAEVAEVLATCDTAESPAHPAAHNDLTPWNLRRDHRRQIWLYDWEDWGHAPPDSDQVYYAATSYALEKGTLPAGLARSAVEHWTDIVRRRDATNRADELLAEGIMEALAALADVARAG